MKAAFTNAELNELNGAKATPSPFGIRAAKWLIGTRLNEFRAAIVALQSGSGIADLGVTTAKLAALAVTAAKLAADAVTTAKIAAGAVTGVKLSIPTSVPLLTAGAEASNHIDVTVALQDQDGVALARVERLRCQAFDANMLASLTTAITLAEVGAGTEVSTTAKAGLLIDTDANGAATVRVTDVSGSLVGTIYLLVEPLNKPGTPRIIACVFA